MVQNQTRRTFPGHLHFIASAEIIHMICLFYSSSHPRNYLCSSSSVSKAFTIQLGVRLIEKEAREGTDVNLIENKNAACSLVINQ